MKDKMCGFIFLMVILSLGLFLAPFVKNLEGFTLNNPGEFPVSVTKAILNDYPQIGQNEVSTYNYGDIWKDYPVFSVGSYEQITNNLRYYKNPDNGTCRNADFCGAFYHDKKNASNIIKPLKEAEEGPGARVNYYRTESNKLYYSIPTNENILY
jgi:hypothetical protein